MSLTNIEDTLVTKPAPCVGVLCIDKSIPLCELVDPNITSYIAASYVKFLEGAGAKVVPIWIGRPTEYYENMMSKVNGILLPGGGVYLEKDKAEAENKPNKCVESAKIIYDLAMSAKNFPLWGTCLGFQLMMVNAADSINVRSSCRNFSTAMPLKLVPGYENSKLLSNMARPFDNCHMCHHHNFCISLDNFERFKLNRDWRVLATQDDVNGVKYVNIVEHCTYPIFGTQFHPERSAYEEFEATNLTNTPESIEFTQHLAKAFIEACRNNKNTFATVEEGKRHLIYNWNPEFTARLPFNTWLQCYMFQKDVDYPKE